MKCPSCGNNNAECIIGNYWSCPGADCTNNAKNASASTEWALDRGTWEFAKDLACVPRIIPYKGNPPSSDPGRAI